MSATAVIGNAPIPGTRKIAIAASAVEPSMATV